MTSAHAHNYVEYARSRELMKPTWFKLKKMATTDSFPEELVKNWSSKWKEEGYAGICRIQALSHRPCFTVHIDFRCSRRRFRLTGNFTAARVCASKLHYEVDAHANHVMYPSL